MLLGVRKVSSVSHIEFVRVKCQQDHPWCEMMLDSPQKFQVLLFSDTKYQAFISICYDDYSRDDCARTRDRSISLATDDILLPRQ